MRVLIDDKHNLVTTYEMVEVQGQQVEVQNTYQRKNPEITNHGDKVVIKGHPRTGAVLKVHLGDDVFEGVMHPEYGSQDVLAQIASSIQFDDTPRSAELHTDIDDVYTMFVTGALIDDIEPIDFDHEPLPSKVQEILSRHMNDDNRG